MKKTSKNKKSIDLADLKKMIKESSDIELSQEAKDEIKNELLKYLDSQFKYDKKCIRALVDNDDRFFEWLAKDYVTIWDDKHSISLCYENPKDILAIVYNIAKDTITAWKATKKLGIAESKKVTLTIGQLKRLIKEASENE